MTPKVLLAALIGMVSSVAAAEDVADNWHQWRGPNATGVAPKGNPPVQWDEETNIKWKVEIPGNGSSTPIVWGNQVFILTAIKTDRVAETFMGIWRRHIGARGNNDDA